MNRTSIELYKKTGEFRATIDFTRKKVDWNVIHNHVLSGCHCVWVESDLESYVRVYGHEDNCVRQVLDGIESYVKLES